MSKSRRVTTPREKRKLLASTMSMKMVEVMLWLENKKISNEINSYIEIEGRLDDSLLIVVFLLYDSGT